MPARPPKLYIVGAIKNENMVELFIWIEHAISANKILYRHRDILVVLRVGINHINTSVMSAKL